MVIKAVSLLVVLKYDSNKLMGPETDHITFAIQCNLYNLHTLMLLYIEENISQ